MSFKQAPNRIGFPGFLVVRASYGPAARRQPKEGTALVGAPRKPNGN